MKLKLLSHVLLFATPWTVAYQALWSMGFSGQEYWSGLSFPSPGIFLTQGSNPSLLNKYLKRETVSLSLWQRYFLNNAATSLTPMLLMQDDFHSHPSDGQDLRFPPPETNRV